MYTQQKRILQQQVLTQTKCKNLVGFMGPNFNDYNKFLKKFDKVLLFEKDLTLLNQIKRNQSNLSVFGMELTPEQAVELWNTSTNTFFDFDFCGTIGSYRRFVKYFFKYAMKRRNHFQFTFSIRRITINRSIDLYEGWGGKYKNGYYYRSGHFFIVVLRSF